MSRILDFIGLGMAGVTAVFLLVIMFKWPPGRDPRPMAPALALAVAFFFLKLPLAMDWEVLFPKEREYAWKIWYIVLFANFMLFAFLQGRRRDDAGPGGACAVKRGPHE